MNRTPPPSPHRTVILLIEHNVRLRAALRAWLQQEFWHCRVEAVADLALAKAATGDTTPEVALVDIDARQGDGYEALRWLRARFPGAVLIALSLFDSRYFGEAAVAAGADHCACIALSDDSLRDLLLDWRPTSLRSTT